MTLLPNAVGIGQSDALLSVIPDTSENRNRIVWTSLRGNATGDFRQIIHGKLHSVLAVQTVSSADTFCGEPLNRRLSLF